MKCDVLHMKRDLSHMKRDLSHMTRVPMDVKRDNSIDGGVDTATSKETKYR